ncbi:MAG: alanine--tRNA ligase [Acetivibrionales bacterium]
MQKLGLNEIRERFLSFFESKGHLRLPSFSLVPQNDPSILLINAGMTPLKPYFTGQETPPRTRVATCQKCIRTPDIENVGKTARHGTFFEMLGNFSFGDYFKKEAIAWAWEFVTEDLSIPADRLYASIYLDDDEAYRIWNEDIGLTPDRIFRMGKEDNFWEHGIGPCGPCSEIYFDRGPKYGCGKPDCKVGCDCDRYMEFWNLVFTQFNKDEKGNYTLLEKKNIDTGLGLERLAVIMQGVENLFEVDTIRNILDYICKIAGVEYGKEYKQDVSIRVITDHIRSTTMMVSDGVLPSNEGRGYVLRRLLRRAARHGKLLGMDRPFLYDVASIVMEESGQAYPALVENKAYIMKVIKTEEERFDATINQGLEILNEYIESIKKQKNDTLSGKMLFKLHDTYGFPLDLTREIAEENSLSIDEEGFEKEMEKQKKKAREALKDKNSSAWGRDVYSQIDKDLKTEFVGYGQTESDAVVKYIVKNEQLAANAQEGDKVVLILDKTPFYAESGGQIGDAGYIHANNCLVKIEDCKKTPDGKYLHIGIVEKGIIEEGSVVKAVVCKERRMAIARNHTTTHLLHRALRNVLGEHVSQAGSLVEADRFRFDFTHFSPVSEEELERIENEVNQKILENLTVKVEEMAIEEAKNIGATALFGEKYGSRVRVISIGGYSTELCGGTHLGSTSEACLIKILSETGVAAGVRRIEALTGEAAIRYFSQRDRMLNSVAEVLKTGPNDTLKKIEALTAQVKDAEKEIEQLRNRLVSGSIEDLLSETIDINGVKVVTGCFDQLDMEALRNAGDMLRNKMGTGIVILGTSYGGKVGFVAMATKDAVQKGIHSGKIISKVAKIAGGGGGGRPDMAQAGGKDISKIDEALSCSIDIIKNQLG